MAKKKKQYAKVLDNFGENDKGKEKYIGEVGEVVKIECDYFCFSQVQVLFKNGKKLWFPNTTLDEVNAKGEKL